MELDSIRENLSAIYRGKHTLQGFLKKKASLGIALPEAISVYLFPGTLQLDDGVICYVPKMDAFHCFSLEDLEVLKPVVVYLDKAEMAKDYSVAANNLATKFEIYVKCLPNKYLRNALANLLMGLTAKKRLTSEQYNAAMYLLKRLRTEFPSDVLGYLENLVQGYYRLCEKVSQQNEKQRLVMMYRKMFEKVSALDGPEVEIAKKQFHKLFKVKQININEVLSFGKAKIVLQLLFLIEALEDKQFLLLSEIVSSFKQLRKDLTIYFSDELLQKAISSGLERLVEDGFVEKNPLETYSLTKEGRTLGCRLIGIDYENTDLL